MTILANATFAGLSHNVLRPSAFSATTTIQTLLKDQAAVYEALAGAATPNAAGQTATSHVHDGTNGAPIRIPLGHYNIGARFEKRTTSLGSDEGYYPFVHVPFYVPTGIASVIVLCTSWTPGDTAATVQCAIEDTSLAATDEQGPGDSFVVDREGPTSWLRSRPHEIGTFGFLMAVTAGAWNVLRVDAWDGLYMPDQYTSGSNSQDTVAASRDVRDVIIIPTSTAPISPPVTPSPAFTDDVSVETPAAYQDFDAAFVADDRAIPSWLLVHSLRNDALLYELLTGQPAANRSSATHAGHNHKDDAATSLDDAGADIEQPLGSWSYGCLRPPITDNDPATWLYDDHPAGDNTYDSAWTGAVVACVITSGVAAGYREAYNHRFRCPAMTSANLAANIDVALLVYSGTSGGVQVRASIGDEDTASFGTASTTSDGTDGKKLLILTGVDGEAEESIQTLKIEFGPQTNKGVPQTALLGSAIAYTA